MSSAGVVLGSAVGVTNAQRAEADAGTVPTIHPTGEWGALPPASPVTMLRQPPTKLFVHHTATANSTDYSLQHAYDLARAIQRYHMTSRGWIDTGQHFTLTRGGHALEGRHRTIEALQNGHEHVVGAHCYGQNDFAIGIENEGTYTSVEPRAEHYAALVELSAYICQMFGIRAYQIYGHRDFNSTDCPGDRLYAMLPGLRSDVAARIGGDPAAPVWPVLRLGARAERVRALQYLLRASGATIDADGDFGNLTDGAVRTFQAAVHADVDGIAGRQTWNQLMRQLSRGSSGEAVKAVQNQLEAVGIPAGGVDGAFGQLTEAAVITFQDRSGLPVDGVVDPRTFARLVA